MSLKEDVIYSLDGFNVELLEHIPFILQDLFKIGSDPEVIKNLMESLQLSPESTVIDLGCGKGAVSVEIAKRLNLNVVGVDAMPEFIEEAEKMASKMKVAELCKFEVGEEEAVIILPIIGVLIGGFFIITSGAGLIGGIGLYKRKSWSRLLLLIVSILDLFNIPIGTAVGIYTIWVLMQEEAIQLLN